MTDDDLGFDPADTELARRLGAAAPAAGDTDAVLAGLRPRLTRARRRRQAGMVAIGTAVMVVLAGVAFAAADPGNDSKVRVPPATRPPSTLETGPVPTTPIAPTTPITTPDGRSSTPSPTSPANGATAPTTPPSTAPNSPPTTADDHGANRGPGGSGSGGSGSGSNSGSGSLSSGSSGASGSGAGSSSG